MCPEPKRPAVVVPDMDISEPITDIMQWADEVVLLYVHVIGVEMDHHIVGADVVGKIEGRPCRIDDVRLVAVANFETEHHQRRASLAMSRNTATALLRPRSLTGRTDFPKALYSAPVSTLPPIAAVASSEACSSLACHVPTTAPSSLDTSASKASPREERDPQPCTFKTALRKRRARRNRRSSRSCSDNSRRS